MADVVSLRGVEILDTRARNEDLVKVLSELLEQAQAGEMIGLIYAVAYYDKTTASGRNGTVGYGLLGRIEATKTAVISELNNG